MSDHAATLRSLEDAALDGLGIPMAARRKAEQEAEKATEVGILGVGLHSTDGEIEDWEGKLWASQDSLVEELAREWTLHILYDANYQYLTYHRGVKRWIPLQMLPWRVRSVYNLIHKSLNWRVSRLTENKPQVNVQARSLDQQDVERAEFKEQEFWYLWDALKLHGKMRLARRWSGWAGSGFLKFGWDSMAGVSEPATKFFEEDIEIEVPPEPGYEMEAELVGDTSEKLKAPVEYYVDDKGNKLGRKWEVVQDEEAGIARRKLLDPPEGTATINDGEAYCDLRTPFNIRWDQYVDDLPDSWYVQDSMILTASKILDLFPESVEVLKRATKVSGGDRAVQTFGLSSRWAREVDGGSYQRVTEDAAGESDALDNEYVVRETWIYPKTEYLKKLWGPDGRVIITIGGALAKHYPMPRWAREACNFVAVTEDYEPGNHYRRPFLRDLIPLQDDINRSRSHIAEAGMVAARMVLGALQNHQINLKLLGHMPGVLMTYKSPQHKPEVLRFEPNIQPMDSFYQSSIQGLQDLANMNEASTGKLPSAGLAAKAIYALQYADERSITEASNAQDETLEGIARILDLITRYEYSEARKIRVVGENRYYLTMSEIQPEHLQAEVDYRFVPGSMLERQKESVRNEIMTMLEAGIITPIEAKRMMPSAVPGGLRRSQDQNEAKARRQVQKVLDGGPASQPQPWDNAPVHLAVIEETMLSVKWDHLTDEQRAALQQMWQAYQLQANPQQPPGGGGGAPAPTGAGTPPIGSESEAGGFPTPAGSEAMGSAAEVAMEPPSEFTEARAR